MPLTHDSASLDNDEQITLQTFPLNGASSVRGIPRIYVVYPVNLFSIY